MKPLKIRAWDDILNEMIYSKPEQFDDSLLFRFDKHFETDKPIYMQFTGLKDKNGKEIYEGDIIRYEWDDEVKIDFMEFRGAMFTVSKAARWNYHRDEVIGNIYETPNELTP